MSFAFAISSSLKLILPFSPFIGKFKMSNPKGARPSTILNKSARELLFVLVIIKVRAALYETINQAINELLLILVLILSLIHI